MSGYDVISQVSTALRERLFPPLTDDLRQFFQTAEAIHVGPPDRLTENHNLNIFLYQVTEDPHLKNRPRRSTSDTPPLPADGPSLGMERQALPPMALRLHYLITPSVQTSDSGPDSTSAIDLILGRVLATMYDAPTLDVLDPETSAGHEVRAIFDPLSVAEQAEVWEAIQQPYRVSLPYQVRVPLLDSKRTTLAVPVGEVERGYVGVRG